MRGGPPPVPLTPPALHSEGPSLPSTDIGRGVFFPVPRMNPETGGGPLLPTGPGFGAERFGS